MASLNKVQLIGYLGSNPEKKVTAGGTSVVSVSIATTNYYKDQTGQSQSSTDWHRLVFWKNLADNIATYTKKGSLIYVEGRLQTREWTKDEVRHFTTEVVAERVQFLDKKEQSEGSSNNYYNPQQSNTTNAGTGQSNNFSGATQVEQNDDFVEDDVPF
jgi:single-strand DNA-binding protein